ncbi:MAG: PqqD family protein [Sciscionella sp.]
MRIRTDARTSVTSLDDGGLAILSRSGRVFRANVTAADMWGALDAASGDPAVVAATTADRYGISPQQARADLDGLVERLQNAGLAVIEP